MIFRRFFAVIPVWALVVACGSGGGTRGPALGAPEVPWDAKTRDEKRGYMASHVEPEMRRLFQKHSAKSYASFGCETCHGDDMEVVNFVMPNSLYALPEKDTIAEATSYDEETTKFMVDEVMPTFARLLDRKVGGPGGVTCLTCHPHD